jgi:glycosyltransferase involved in cell wall biosynthesis
MNYIEQNPDDHKQSMGQGLHKQSVKCKTDRAPVNSRGAGSDRKTGLQGTSENVLVAQKQNSSGESQRRLRIAHVEVGGTLGGSSVCADLHLRFCDDRFDHELLFYSLPKERQLQCGKRHVIRDLGLPSPSIRSRLGGQTSAVRQIVGKIPIVARLATVSLRFADYVQSVPRAFKLAKIFRAGNYDLIHCNNNFNYQPATVIGAWIARKPLVAHYRTPVPLSMFDRWLGRRAKIIVAINSYVAKELADQGISQKVIVCHDPCEQPRANRSEQLRRALLGPASTLLVGTISRLEVHKGIHLFLRAAKLLRPSWPQVRYVIVGAGSQVEALRTLAGQLQLQDCVEFTGFVPDAFEYLACLDLFVCPSYVEGGPLTVLEAMKLGKAVVTTQVGAVSEWIRDAEQGTIVPVGDVTALVTSIGKLLMEEKTRARMGRMAALRAHQLCAPSKAAKELDSVFSEALDGTVLNQTRSYSTNF